VADTQAAPQLVKALTGVLPDGAIRQLMQALGNCTQPYSSRAATNIQPNNSLGNRNGVYTGGRWNPSDYPGLIPAAGLPQGSYELPSQGGYTSGDWNMSNYGGNSFYFPSSSDFNLNSYFGGPTFNVGGNTTFENQNVVNQTVTNQVAQNITVQSINGIPVGGGGGAPSGSAPGDPADPSGGLGQFGGGGGAVPGVPSGVPFFPWNPFTPQDMRDLERYVRDQVRSQFNALPQQGRGTVRVPGGATLTEDCKIKFSYRDAPVR